MKINKNSGAVFYISMVITYLSVIILMFLFFNNIQVRNSIITRYQVERTAFALIESFRQDRLAADLEVTDYLEGFGIYKVDGSKIYTWKKAPDFIDPRSLIVNERMPFMHVIDSDSSGFYFDNIRKSLRLTRPVINMPLRGLGLRRINPGDSQSPAFIFIEQTVPEYFRSYNLLKSGRFIIPLFLLAIVFIIAYLYKKNSDYKNRLAQNSELIKLGEVARTLAHEIKNPLSVIRMQTGLLSKTLMGQGAQEILIIEEEVLRLKTLTDRISDFLRDPAGDPEKIHLESFIRDLLKRFNFDIRFNSSLQGDVVILFDKERLRSVLENIIKNGIESYAGKKSNGQPYLEINTCEENKIPVLRVADRGSGIAPHIKEKMFMAPNTNKEAGSGIGLAVAKRFIEAAGAAIELTDREEGGTEVKIFFKKV